MASAECQSVVASWWGTLAKNTDSEVSCKSRLYPSSILVRRIVGTPNPLSPLPGDLTCCLTVRDHNHPPSPPPLQHHQVVATNAGISDSSLRPEGHRSPSPSKEHHFNYRPAGSARSTASIRRDSKSIITGEQHTPPTRSLCHMLLVCTTPAPLPQLHP